MAHSDNVSRHVLDIVAAFTSVRDVMRKLRARTQGSKKAGKPPKTSTGGELRLNESLRRGPVEIEAQYAQGLRAFGDCFGQGDQHACLDMSTILMRLNYGLVNIISEFLGSPRSSRIRLDYEALTALSNSSSLQARHSLAALAQRLANPSPRQIMSTPQSPGDDNAKEPLKSRRRHKAIPEGAEYYSISKQKNETQIALVRPARKGQRTMSTDSARLSSADSRITEKRNSGNKPPTKSAQKGTPTPKGRSRSTEGSPKDHDQSPCRQTAPATSRPATDTTVVDTSAHPARPYHLLQPVQASQYYPPIRNDYQPMTSPAILQPHTQATNPPAIPRRRTDINTETIYTMASASTKLGEIPMHRWAQPFDFETAARLNAEAETANWVSAQMDPRPKKSPGLLTRLFRGRKSVGVAVA